jgi:diaminopimelate epimerase
MIHQIEFVKVSGAGNDFILVDNYAGLLTVDWVKFAQAACSRHFGIGADGLLVIDRSTRADFHMSYFNSDGSSGGMCGNGGRCAARYAMSRGISGPHVVFEALGHLYEAKVAGDSVSLSMQDVTQHPQEMVFADEKGGTVTGKLFQTGSPHVVIHSGDIERSDVRYWGSFIRHHSLLRPDGANVDFLSAAGRNRISLRTYERGVEAETLACGTGAVAAAVGAARDLGMTPPISVSVRSGEELTVDFVLTRTGATGVELTGTAHFIFSGSVLFDESAGRLHQSVTTIPQSPL